MYTMSITVQKLEYDSGEENYESAKDEVEDVVDLLNNELDINYFEQIKGDSLAHVQEDRGAGLPILRQALEGSDSNLSVRDKYLVLE